MIGARITITRGDLKLSDLIEDERIAARILADAVLEKAVENLLANKNVKGGKTLQSGIVLQERPNAWVVRFQGGAVYLEFGTEPHEIRPKNKKALAFPRSGSRKVTRGGKPAGEFAFGGKKQKSGPIIVTLVNHPGTDPSPFLRPAIDYVLANAAQIVRDNQSKYKRGGVN